VLVATSKNLGLVIETLLRT